MDVAGNSAASSLICESKMVQPRKQVVVAVTEARIKNKLLQKLGPRSLQSVKCNRANQTANEITNRAANPPEYEQQRGSCAAIAITEARIRHETEHRVKNQEAAKREAIIAITEAQTRKQTRQRMAEAAAKELEAAITTVESRTRDETETRIRTQERKAQCNGGYHGLKLAS